MNVGTEPLYERAVLRPNVHALIGSLLLEEHLPGQSYAAN